MINIEGKDITQIFYQNKIINHVYYSGEPLQLIEDVDYKTYQWLRLDGYCWIPSGIGAAWNQTVEGYGRYDRAEYMANMDMKVGTSSVALNPAILSCPDYSRKVHVQLCVGGSTRQGHYQFINNIQNNNTYITYSNTNVNIKTGIDEFYMKHTLLSNRTNYLNGLKFSLKHNGNSVSLGRTIANSWVLPTTLPSVYYRIGNMSTDVKDPKTGWANARFSYHSVRNIKIGETSFTPVKLLRDIPSFLAYDNKIHRAGESGMINSTTGKFHGKYETGEGGTVLAHNGEVI